MTNNRYQIINIHPTYKTSKEKIDTYKSIIKDISFEYESHLKKDEILKSVDK